MQSLRTKRQDVSQFPDADLVALVRAGNGPAFAAIMTRYNQRLYRVARGIVRDEAEAEDVLQEAYVRAFAALQGFRGEASLGTWLTRIVMNEALGRMPPAYGTTRNAEIRPWGVEILSLVMFPGVRVCQGTRA